MAIDNPKEKFEQHYMKDEPKALELAKHGIELGFPDGGLAPEILVNVANALFDQVSTRERVRAMWELLKIEFGHIEKTKASHQDLENSIQLAFTYDRMQRDDRKRERYLRVIGTALRSEEQVQHVVSFIQTLERLNERDIIVLKVINKVMNKQGDWFAKANPGTGEIMALHPSTLSGRGQELANAVALALGQKVEKNAYSREEGFGICNRLQGFGLVHEIEVTRELPLTNYTFRLSAQGIRLLKLLGEDVPNYDYYFRDM